MNLPSSSGTKMHSELPTPAAKIRTLDDGCVRIQVGDGPGAFVGVVSSHHLVEPKILQLQHYWRKVNQP